jgi:AraC-like DNA-binding protein
MDLLNELLAGIRFKGLFYFKPAFDSPWSVRIGQDTPSTIRLHLVTHGEFWIGMESQPRRELLRVRDFAVIANGAEHIVADSSDRAPMYTFDMESRTTVRAANLLPALEAQLPELSCQLMCGYFPLDTITAKSLMQLLPPILIFRAESNAASAQLLAVLDYAVALVRNNHTDAQVIMQRLAEILMIEVVREWARKSPPSRGFLAGAADHAIARALSAMHQDMSRQWTVSDLAILSGMSRTAFVVRFSSLIGIPPMTYLANWRLAIARRLIIDDSLSLERISAQVGYRSYSSFIRRFSRIYGTTPGELRRIG